MRYLVTARVKLGKEVDLLRAIESGTLGTGSVAGDEYLRNMTDARLLTDGRIQWVETHFVRARNALPVRSKPFSALFRRTLWTFVFPPQFKLRNPTLAIWRG